MMTIGRLSLGLCLMFGCSVGETMEPGGIAPWSPSLDQPREDEDDREDEDTDGETDGETDDDEDPTWGDQDEGTSTGEEPEMGSSTGEEPPEDEPPEDDPTGDGGQPTSGPWSACPADGACGPGLSCIVSELIVASLCVESCLPGGDPSSCSPAPGGDATPACMSVGSNSYCVLDCSAGQTCPSGMVCHEEDGTSICL